MKRRIAEATFVAGICLFLACGIEQIPPEQLTVTIAPAGATVARNGTVDLTGNANGFSKTPVLSWYMAEGPTTPATPAPYCGYLVPKNTPNTTACIYGYITYVSDSGTSGVATYHAPDTPGTYHVVFIASQFDGFVAQGGKTATAVITVTP